MRRTRAAGAVCFAAVAWWYCAGAMSDARAYPGGKQLTSYAYMGELLVHGIRARANVVSYRMPLATIASAKLQYHSALSAGELMVLNQGLLVLLMFALGCLLHPLGALFTGAAVLAAMPSLGVHVYPDSGYTLLVLLAACLTAWRARAPTPARSVLLAAAVGATLLFRSPLLLFPPVLALYELAARRFALRAYWRHLAILCLVPYLFLLPWTGMNWTIHRKVIPFEKDAASANIMTGALGTVGDTEGDLTTLVDEPIDLNRSGEVLGWAAREILRHPLRYAHSCVRRAAYAFSLQPLLFLLALVSAWVFRKRPEFRELGVLSAYFLGVHCLMSVEPRYFLPLWPLLAVQAAALLAGFRAKAPLAPNAPEYRLAALAAGGVLALVLLLGLYANWIVASYATLVRSGRQPDDADFSRALDANPGDVWLLRERGLERLARGDVRAAVLDLGAASALEPGDSRVRLQLAWARALLGDPAPLLSWRPEHGELNVNDGAQLEIDAAVLRACAYIHLGQAAKAAAPLKAAFKLFKERDIVVRGPQGEHEVEVLKRLRTSDAGFSLNCSLLQGERPPVEKAALNEALSKLFPASSQVWIERAELAERAGRREEALAALAKAGGFKPNDDEQLRLAELHGKLGSTARAFAALDGLIRRRPRDVRFRLERAELAASAGAREEALASALEAERLDPGVDDRRRLVGIYRKIPDDRRAQAVLDALVRRFPGDAGLRLELGETSAQLGERAAALEAASRAEAIGLDDEQRRAAAALYRKLKEPRREYALLEPLARRFPDDAGLLIEMAEAAEQLGERPVALRAADRAESLGLDDARLGRAAALYAKLGEPRRASRVLSKLAAASGLDDGQRRLAASLYRGLKDYRRALSALEGVKAENAELALEKASVSILLGEKAAARGQLLRAERLAPSAEQRHAIALAYQDLAEYGRAVAILDGLIARDPSGAELLGDRGLCRHLKGDASGALDDLEKAIRLKPEALQFYLTLGAVHVAHGRRAEAVKVYDRGLAAKTGPEPDPLRETLLAARRESLRGATRAP